MISRDTVGGLLRTTSALHPDREALVFPDSRQTYAELQARVDEWARQLIGLGVAPGEHVGLSMTNTPEFVELVFAICSVGAVAVPINPRYRASELAHVVADSDVSVVIVGRPPADEVDLLDRLAEAVPGLDAPAGPSGLDLESVPRLRWVVSVAPTTVAGVLSVDELAARRADVPDEELTERYARVRVRGPGLIMYTSGTTARPKGAVLSHEAMVRTAVSLAHGRYLMTPEDRFWDPLPLFHMSGLLPLVATVSAGSTFLCMSRADPAGGLRMMRDERATIAFFAFAQLALDLVTQSDYRPEDLSSLRIVHTSGLPEAVVKVQAAFPHAVQVSPYGCTEVGGMCSTSELSDTDEQRATFSGRPYPGLEIRVVDELGSPVAPGVRGEILVRGYSMFDGYYNNPKATAAVVDADGWFHTGDLGELDADGRVRYISRLKDMLKVGGENVACVEIENLLCSHPAVVVAAVVGVPHERLAEVPFAFVELVPGAEVTEQDLIDFCTGAIASFKVPRTVRFVTEWPMSATKIQKHRLREVALAEDVEREGVS